MLYPNNIDAAAEREGMAAERLAELLGTEVPETPLQRELGYARTAAALGLPARPPLRPYRRFDSCRVHDYLTQRAPWKVLVWGRPKSKQLPADCEIEKKRQAEKRLMRARNLISLQYIPAKQLVAIPDAVQLTGIGQRSIERALSNGRLVGVVATGRRRLIRAGSLRKLLAEKLAGRSIAALSAYE